MKMYLDKLFEATKNLARAFSSLLLANIGIDKNLIPNWAKLHHMSKRIFKSVEKSPEGGVIVSEVNGNIYITAGIAILAGLCAHKKNSKVVLLDFAESTELFIHRLITRSILSCEFVRLDEISGIKILNKKGIDSVEKLLNIRYDDIPVGDIAYDMSLRYGCDRATVEDVDESVAGAIGRLWAVLRASEQIYEDYEVNGVVVSHAVGRGGAVIRYFASNGIQCIKGFVGSGVIRKYNKYEDGALPYPAEMNAERVCGIAEELNEDDELVQAADEYVRGRVSQVVTDSDSVRAFDGDFITSRDTFAERVGLRSEGPNVFVMLHAFTDHPSAHHDNKAFRDYYRWFIETLKFVQGQENVNWIFKQHPSADRYPNDANLSGIFKVVDDDHIAFISSDDNFNSKSLVEIADAVVTCVGTAGIEFPCFGVPSITAGEPHYAGLDVANVATSKQAYFNLLCRASSLPEVGPRKQRRARIALFLLYSVEKYDSNNLGLGVDSPSSGSHENEDVIENLAQGLEKLSNGRIETISEFIDSEKKIFVDEKFRSLQNKELIP